MKRFLVLAEVEMEDTQYSLLEDVCKAADTIATDKAFDELEEAMLRVNMCPSGNCET